MKLSILFAEFLILCSFSCTFLRAHTTGMAEFTCPIDGKKFESRQDFSGTSFGVRLDLKKLGPIAQPWALAECPNCYFVIYDDEFSQKKIARLKPYILSEDYKQYHKNPSYYRLARIFEFLNRPASDVAWHYLQASWQCERDSKMHSHCLNESLKAYKRSKKEDLEELERLISQYLQIEINRRLSNFDQAMAALKQIPSDYPLTMEWLYDAVPYQKTLIEAQDPSIHNLDEAPENPRKMNLKLAKAKQIEGFDRLPKDIKFYRLRVTDERISCGMNWKSNRLVNTATWDAKLNGDDSPNWSDFIQVIEKAEEYLAPHEWLWNWRKLSDDNRIEIRVYGDHFLDGDEMHEKETWRALKLKGEPKLAVILRKPESRWNGLLLGDEEPMVLMTSARHRRFGSDGYEDFSEGQWFERINFNTFYSEKMHSKENLPSFVLVDRAGNVRTNIPEVQKVVETNGPQAETKQ